MGGGNTAGSTGGGRSGSPVTTTSQGGSNMGGGGTETTTSTTAPANPEVTATTNKLLGGIREAYDAGMPVFGKSLYAGTGANTQGGWESMLAASRQPNYFSQANNFAGGLVNSGGLTGGQQGNIGTQNGLAGQYSSIAGGLSGPSAAQTGLQGMADAGGTNATMQGAAGGIGGLAGQFGGLAGSFANPSAAQNGFMGMYGQAGDPSLTENTMMGVARGDHLNNTDPNFQAMVDRAANQTSADINAAMGGNGRYGSNVHVGALGEEIGALRTNAAAQNRQLELSRQQQALGAIEGQRQTGFSNRANSLGAADQARQAQAGMQMSALGQQGSALNNLFGMGQQAFGNQANALQGADAARLSQLGARMGAMGAQGDAATNAFGMDQQGVANGMGAAAALPGLFGAMQMPGQIQNQIGLQQDADRQAGLMAENDMFRRQGDAKRNLLGELSSILAGNAAVGGSTTSQTSPTTDWWQSMLGIGMGLL